MKKNYNCQYEEKLIICEKNKIHQININEIEYIYSAAGVSIINKSDKSKIIVSKNLSYFEKQLANLEFEKANRNEIVNCAFISSFDFKQRTINVTNTIIKVSCRNLKKIAKNFKYNAFNSNQ